GINLQEPRSEARNIAGLRAGLLRVLAPFGRRSAPAYAGAAGRRNLWTTAGRNPDTRRSDPSAPTARRLAAGRAIPAGTAASAVAGPVAADIPARRGAPPAGEGGRGAPPAGDGGRRRRTVAPARQGGSGRAGTGTARRPGTGVPATVRGGSRPSPVSVPSGERDAKAAGRRARRNRSGRRGRRAPCAPRPRRRWPGPAANHVRRCGSSTAWTEATQGGRRRPASRGRATSGRAQP